VCNPESLGNTKVKAFVTITAFRAMSLVGNLIWLVFGGLLAGLGYILGGLSLCLTLIGIPFGLG
jgi:uncharacterized membrane protein YccF (DUF307 family)